MKEKLVGLGAILMAGLASICCLGPVLLIGLGVSALTAAGLERYRPFFILLTVLLLGLAFYLAYRKREIRCEDGSCQYRAAGAGTKISLWIVLFAVLVMVSKPYWAVFSNSACCVPPLSTRVK
jgi:mercuric ion transport protein